MSQTSYYCSLLKPACKCIHSATMRHIMLYYKIMRYTLKVLISDCYDMLTPNNNRFHCCLTKRRQKTGRRINKKIWSSASHGWMPSLSAWELLDLAIITHTLPCWTTTVLHMYSPYTASPSVCISRSSRCNKDHACTMASGGVMRGDHTCKSNRV